MRDSNFGIDDLVQAIILLAPHEQIAHHVPGRIRLKILPSGLDAVKSIDVQNMIESIPGVLLTRLNFLARSLVIEYDRDQLPYDLWESLGQLRNHPDLAHEVAERLRILLDGAGRQGLRDVAPSHSEPAIPA
jgi:hypothetical protein